MTVGVASTKNVLGNENRELYSYAPAVNNTPTPYVRPSDWLTLPTIGPTDQRFVGLYAVTDDDTNFVAFTFTTTSGSYVVDWGDGTSDTVTSGVLAQHKYTYSTLSSTVSTRGYKMAIISVTGNIQQLNFNRKYTNISPALANGFTTKWLDVAVGGSTLAKFQFWDGLTTQVYHPMLEQVSIISTKTNEAALLMYAFNNCWSLQSFPTFNISAANPTAFNQTFDGCYSLRAAPNFTTAGTPVQFVNTFSNCRSLIYVPDYDFEIQRLDNAFQSCYSLRKAPALKTSTAANFAGIFGNCPALQDVPNWNTGSATSLNQAFVNCISLQTAPFWNTKSVTDFTNCFSGCSELKTFPSWNMQAGQNFTTMFSNCYGLTKIANVNIPAATNTTSMFQNCQNLQRIDKITTSALLTNTSSMFNVCRSLTEIPLFNTSGVTNASVMFQQTAISTLPAFDFGNNLNFTFMFTQCVNLVTAPTFNTIKGTNFSNMFQGCPLLTTFPTYDTGNATSFTTMFTNCASILTAPTFTSTAKVTDLSYMFENCNRLVTVPNYNTANVTSMNGFINLCKSIQTLPAFNLTNCTQYSSFASSANNFVGFDGTVNMFNATGSPTFDRNFSRGNSIANLKITTSFTNCRLDKTNLEYIFANSRSNTTSQTFTITGNPGADTVVTRTGTTTANSAVITMANTVGLTANMILTSGNGFGIANNASTLYQANSTIVLTTGQAPANGMPISIATAPSGVTGFTQFQPYYVANSGVAAANAFQISTSNGGSALSFTGTGTLAGQVRFATYINSVVANTSITVSNPATAAFTGNSYIFRILDVSQAVLKNWTVSG